MNCSNYANWELTQLLPDKSLIDEDTRYQFIIDEDNELEIFRRSELSEYNKIAWSWEDIRLYLASKGFHVEIYSDDVTYEINFHFPECKKGIYPYENLSPFPASDNEFWWDRPTPLEYKEYPTYEEAREDGIKWCLELIKINE